jgi:uncharacterized membrane protein YjfL (UPF0719 family)
MEPSTEATAVSTATTAAFGAGTVLVLLVAHRMIQSLFDRKSSLRANLLGDNGALALREVGDILAVFLIAPAIVKSVVKGESLAHDLRWCGAFAAVGLVLLELSGLLGVRLLLRKRLAPALERNNCAAGVAVACHYVAMGVLVSRAAAGEDLRGIGLSLAFFALALVTHQLLLVLFRAFTPYDAAEQIEGENLAAAVSFGGLSIAIAIVLARALTGDFVDWPTSLAGFGGVALTALGFYPLRQIVVQGLLAGSLPSLRGGALDLAIGRDRRVGAAALEAACYVGAALSISLLA